VIKGFYKGYLVLCILIFKHDFVRVVDITAIVLFCLLLSKMFRSVPLECSTVSKTSFLCLM
jgi:hypothetical protein